MHGNASTDAGTSVYCIVLWTKYKQYIWLVWQISTSLLIWKQPSWILPIYSSILQFSHNNEAFLYSEPSLCAIKDRDAACQSKMNDFRYIIAAIKV